MRQGTALSVYMLVLGYEWKDDLTPCTTCLSKVVGKCPKHLSPCSPASASAMTTHLTCSSKVVGGWYGHSRLLMLLSYVGSATMASTNTSISGEHLNCPPSPCPMPSWCLYIRSSKWISLTYNLGVFQTAGFFPPWVSGKTGQHVSSPQEISVSYSIWGCSDIGSTAYSRQMVRSSSFWYRSHGTV